MVATQRRHGQQYTAAQRWCDGDMTSSDTAALRQMAVQQRWQCDGNVMGSCRAAA